MSFLNPISLPVKRYSSADEGAPQIYMQDFTGVFKTLFKACLVTGYGDKQGAGWAIEELDEHQAIFRSQDPQAPLVGLLVDSRLKDMTKFNLLWYGSSPAQQSNFSGDQHDIRRHSWSLTWELVASSRGFCFLLFNRYSNQDHSAMLYFGASQHNLKNPQGQDFIYAPLMRNAYSMSSLLPDALQNRGNIIWAESPTDTRANAAISSAIYFSSTTYPAEKMQASRMYSQLFVAKPNLILGAVPGLLVGSHAISTDQDKAIIYIDGSADTYLLSKQKSFSYSNYVPLLINLNRWEY